MDIVILRDNQAVTTSLMVADKFGKRHKDVLRAIAQLIQSAQTCANLFSESTYLDSRNRHMKMYYMNRDGYTMLVMGFEGKGAIQFKLDYMNAFNRMEAYILEQKQTQLSQPVSQAQLLLQSAQLLVDIETRQNQLEQRTSTIESKFAELEHERDRATQDLLVTSHLLPLDTAATSQRDIVRRLVNEYSAATSIKQNDVWHSVYAELYYKYHISINAYKLLPGEKSKLDIAERIGAIPHLHSIISTLIHNNITHTS